MRKLYRYYIDMLNSTMCFRLQFLCINMRFCGRGTVEEGFSQVVHQAHLPLALDGCGAASFLSNR